MSLQIHMYKIQCRGENKHKCMLKNKNIGQVKKSMLD